MGVQVDNYCTTSFILKDAASVEYIKKFCKLLEVSKNLSSGYLSLEAYCDLTPYGKEENSFIIKTGGYMDSSPSLRASVLQAPEEEDDAEEEDDEDIDYEEEDSIYLFTEVQKHLKEGSWFFVNQYGWARSVAYISVEFYHQDGRADCVSDFDIRKEILKKMGI